MAYAKYGAYRLSLQKEDITKRRLLIWGPIKDRTNNLHSRSQQE
jgi:hypothetical protein